MNRLITTFIAAFAALLLHAQPQTEMKFQTLDSTQFKRLIADPAVQLVDVRTASEYSEGHIPGAINIDVNRPDFDTQAGLLDKKHPVAIYCRSGARSKIAAGKLADKGYTAYELNGGISTGRVELRNNGMNPH